MPGPITILAVDGGGIRGLIPATVLAEIERRAGAPIAQLFDLVAGTSTGGIIALALAKPGAGGTTPDLSASDLVALYEDEGKRIFSSSIWHRVAAAGNLLDERYESGGLESVLRERLGEARLRDALTEVLVTAYELETREPWFFARHKARSRPTHDFPMWQVARATAAAPTYFEPFEVAAMTPHGGLVDGGVFANNPAMCAYAEASKLHGRGSDFLIVSLGTGQYSSPIHYRDAKGWGLALWAKPILNVVFDGVSDTVDHQMQSLCPPGPDGRPRYYRFQCRLDPRCDVMDDASPENVRRLKEKAEAMIDESEDDLATLCNQLAERAPLPA